MSYLRQQHATGATLLSDQCKIHGDWKTKRNCISTVIATNCTSSYKSYRMYHLHSLRWQWLIILRLYSYLLALEFGTRYLFGILKPPRVDVDASFWCHLSRCDAIIPDRTMFFCVYVAFMACKQVNFLLKKQNNPGSRQKKYKQQKHRSKRRDESKKQKIAAPTRTRKT